MVRARSLVPWLVVFGCSEPDPAGEGGSSDTSGTTEGATTATPGESDGDDGGPTTAADDADGDDADDGDGSTSTPGTTDTGTSGECDVADPLAPGDHERMLEHDGQMRRFIVHVPEGHDAGAPAPLLVNMHGLLSNPEDQMQWSQMNESADPRGWIGVYPAGIANSWNAGTCCGDASASGVDDVGFLRAMVADVSGAVCIDPKRIYATGMSNGGHMSFRLACEAADLFAAVGPVAGAMRVTECAPVRPVPVLAFHGVQDLIVPYVDDVASIDGWVATNACDAEFAQEDFEGGNCRTWSGCDADVGVGLCSLDPMGHCWPGGDPDLCYVFLGTHSDAIDADETMLDFFEQHPLP
jgi:polyhydroxybutyrate depolymerase